ASGCARSPAALPVSTQAAHPLRYSDNGDGTITDYETGLMWEKKVCMDGIWDAANPHDADNAYLWYGKCSGHVASCGTNGDCPSGDTCTWRCPSPWSPLFIP